jgi:hypothetical protein
MFLLADIRGQTIQGVLPENPIMLHQLGDFFERSRVQRAHMAASLAPLLQETCSLQIREMLGNSLLGHVEGFSQFAYSRGSSGKPAEDRPARRVGESRKGDAQSIHNRMVVYSRSKVN